MTQTQPLPDGHVAVCSRKQCHQQYLRNNLFVAMTGYGSPSSPPTTYHLLQLLLALCKVVACTVERWHNQLLSTALLLLPAAADVHRQVDMPGVFVVQLLPCCLQKLWWYQRVSNCRRPPLLLPLDRPMEWPNCKCCRCCCCQILVTFPVSPAHPMTFHP